MKIPRHDRRNRRAAIATEAKSPSKSKNDSPGRWSVIKLTQPLYPSGYEFKPKLQTDAFAAVGLPRGLCLGSKSRYRETHRKHYFIPNANVFCRPFGKIWWGDLDLLRHARQLERVARRLRCHLYVLDERDGRFDNTELPFTEVQRRAVWHTGGRVRPDRRLIRRSGLSPSLLATLVGVSCQRLLRPQIPFVAQQINRKLRLLEEFFGPFTRYYGFENWGEWMSARNCKLNGATPLEVVRNGGSVKLDEVFPDVFLNPKLLPDFDDSMVRGLELQYSGAVCLEWPPWSKRSRICKPTTL